MAARKACASGEWRRRLLSRTHLLPHPARAISVPPQLGFYGPALSTVLADPLMSVVDALCVGNFCPTVELASLGPALAVFNFGESVGYHSHHNQPKGLVPSRRSSRRQRGYYVSGWGL